MNEFDRESLDFQRQHRIAERQLLPLFRRALNKQLSRVIEYANTFGLDAMNVEGLIDPTVWRTVYPTAYEMVGMKLAKQEYYRQRNLDGQEQKASAIEFLIDIWSSKLRDFALTYTYLIEKELNDTTIEIIKRALGDAFSLELDRLGRVRFFNKTITDITKGRGLTIARTETTTIANLGKEIGARSWIDEQGGKGYKVWLGRIVGERPTHLEENDTILPIDDLYSLRGDMCDRPGDVRLSAANRINCRCTQSIMSQIRYNAYVKQGRIVNGKLVVAS